MASRVNLQFRSYIRRCIYRDLREVDAVACVEHEYDFWNLMKIIISLHSI